MAHLDSRRRIGVGFSRDRGRIVVTDHAPGLLSQTVQDVFGLRVAPPQEEAVADSQPLQPPRLFRYALQDELVQAVARMLVRAAQGFVTQNWQAQFVGPLDGMQQGVVGIHAPVQPGPVENVFRL